MVVSQITEMCVNPFMKLTYFMQVAPYKKIRKVTFVASVPKTPSGKILRKDLIRLATSKL